MQRKHHWRKKFAVKSFLEYGFHLWILLFISNILLFYTFHLFSFGAAPDSKIAAVSPEVSEAAVDATSVSVSPSAAPTKYLPPGPFRKPTIQPPEGPVISLSFTVPGIGSGGGTMTPHHTTRNLIVFLYATDVNTFDSKIKPIYTMRTKAYFDTNVYSPTYTAFVNPYIDLGDTVKNGRYQIAFSTDQSIRKLVKQKDDAIGGKIVAISRSLKTVLPVQKVVMGDMTPPQGDNVMDIADYNVFVACYAKDPPCPYASQVDLNDDGVIDGIDYNIMALGFKALVTLGFPAPQLPTIVPTQVSKLSELKITPKPKPTAKPSPVPVVKKDSRSNPAGAILGFFIFLIILGAVGFAVSKTKFGKEFLAKHPLPIKFPPAPGKAKDAPAEAPPAQTDAAAPPADEIPPADTSSASIAESSEIPVKSLAESTEIPIESLAESTEIPIADLKKEKDAGANNLQPADNASPTAAPAPAAADSAAVDKTYYVKKKSTDDKGTWVVLTDDAGPIDGLLPKGEIEDGFERIKGTMTEEKGKKYLLITEILPSE